MTAESTIRDIAVTMSDHFGIEVESVRALGSEFNQTFEVRGTGDRRYVAKVFPDDAVDTVRWQHRLMDRIAEAGDVVSPTVLRDRAGRDVAVASTGSGSVICGYSWVDGAVIGDLAEHSAALLEDWGRTAALLVRALQDVNVAGAVPQTHTWDLINAPAAIRRHLADVPDADHRRLIDRVLDLFDRYVAPRAPELPKSVVHQDLNDFNVLVTGDGDSARIAGVIDFGDALYTTTVSEVAIAGAYAMQRKAAPVGALSSVVRGYDRVMPLTEPELGTLYPLAVTRLALNATIWTARRRGATAAYGRARSQHTWTTLQRLSQENAEQVESILRGALDRRESS